MIKHSKRVRKIAGVILFTLNLAHGLNQANVFEWWDEGLITPEEASEILNLLEDGNMEEACLLTQAYALESCIPDKPRKHSPKKELRAKTTNHRPSLAPHTSITWKGRTDSLGHLESHRAELQMEFYRYRLRLGSQEQFTYRNNESEAYLGQISTQELHSTIPLDTLWGTSLLYPLGNFRLSAALDTAKNTQFRLGYKLGNHSSIVPVLGRSAAVHIFCWHTRQFFSTGIQASTAWGEFSGWWQTGQDKPLLKILLHNESGPISWKSSTYLHGDNVPSQAHLSKSILQNTLWSTQSISYSDNGLWHSKVSATARMQEGDSLSARFKFQAESGPHFFRGTLAATCLNASQDCSQKDLSQVFSSTLHLGDSQFTASASIKSRHKLHQGFSIPKLELAASLQRNQRNQAKLVLSLPKTRPSKEILIRSEASVNTDILLWNLTVTFQSKNGQKLHPLRAYLQGTVQFKP